MSLLAIAVLNKVNVSYN